MTVKKRILIRRKGDKIEKVKPPKFDKKRLDKFKLIPRYAKRVILKEFPDGWVFDAMQKGFKDLNKLHIGFALKAVEAMAVIGPKECYKQIEQNNFYDFLTSSNLMSSKLLGLRRKTNKEKRYVVSQIKKSLANKKGIKQPKTSEQPANFANNSKKKLTNKNS